MLAAYGKRRNNEIVSTFVTLSINSTPSTPDSEPSDSLLILYSTHLKEAIFDLWKMMVSLSWYYSYISVIFSNLLQIGFVSYFLLIICYCVSILIYFPSIYFSQSSGAAKIIVKMHSIFSSHISVWPEILSVRALQTA